MAAASKNPFYVLLLVACAAMLMTMLTYLTGWMYMPNPDRPMKLPPRPPIMIWVDRNILMLLVVEFLAVFGLALTTILSDNYFDPPGASANQNANKEPENGDVSIDLKS